MVPGLMVRPAPPFPPVQSAGWVQLTLGVIAFLLGATGLGNLAYYLMARKLG